MTGEHLVQCILLITFRKRAKREIQPNKLDEKFPNDFQGQWGWGWGWEWGTWVRFHPMFQDLCSTGKNLTEKWLNSYSRELKKMSDDDSLNLRKFLDYKSATFLLYGSNLISEIILRTIIQIKAYQIQYFKIFML